MIQREDKRAQKLKHVTEEFQQGPSRAPYVTILELETRRSEHTVTWIIDGAQGTLGGQPRGDFWSNYNLGFDAPLLLIVWPIKHLQRGREWRPNQSAGRKTNN